MLPKVGWKYHFWQHGNKFLIYLVVYGDVGVDIL
jgi:hypothetical protein